MKTPLRLILVGLCATSLMSLQAARADGDSTNSPPSGPPHGMRDHHFPPWIDQLDLTDAQKEQIKEIIKQTDEERRQKIEAVLTPEQKAKLDQIMAAHKPHDGGNGDTPPPTPPADSGSTSTSN